jgi:SiaC family regulatory phosphoprotein
MNPLRIEETDNTPHIDFNPDTGDLWLTGESFPDLAHEFYKPVVEWFQSYVASTRGPIYLRFKFSYFNTSTSKYIINFLSLAEGASAAGRSIEVEWHSPKEDNNIKKNGLELADGFNIMFRTVEY